MKFINYNRRKAVAYAHKWAYSRNPAFGNFDNYGGDCTNFASQCLYAGVGVMNYTKDVGWYYINMNDRAAAWTGVEYLYRFLVTNQGAGPFACVTDLRNVLPGDLIQLDLGRGRFSHTLVVVSTGIVPAPDNIRIAAHTFNADNRLLNSYNYRDLRCLHIEGARKYK